jgi:hypothetical protein
VNASATCRTIAAFYPFYLGGHANRTRRRLHFAGTTIALPLLVAAVVARSWGLVAAALVQGYAFAWVGHFFFARNRPATLRYPWFSLLGNWRMWWEMPTGRIRF